MKRYFITTAIALLGLVACNTSNKINTDEAMTLITEYLEENPQY